MWFFKVSLYDCNIEEVGTILEVIREIEQKYCPKTKKKVEEYSQDLNDEEEI